MAVRPIDGNDFMRRLTLDISKGHYGEFMDGSDVAYTSREIEQFVNEMPTLTPPNEPLTPDSRLTPKECDIPIKDFGKTVFLTREAAETVLKEREQNE